MAKRVKRRRAVRRVLPLLLGISLLFPLYAGLELPDGLGELLLRAELGYCLTDEPSSWNTLVTSPLTAPSEEEREESHLPATDSPDHEVPASGGEDGGDATPQTITANSNTLTGTIDLNNNTSNIDVDIEALCTAALTQTIRPAEEGPQILIMHTHGSEAYTMAGEDVYTETDYSRTDDPNYNMIRIGAEMKAVFESMGFQVLHDTTLYDYPAYTGSYTRSLAGIKRWLEQYPTIAVVLDVHRDALIAGDGTVYKAVTDIEGESVAQVMLVCGTNDGGLTHDGWRDNLTMAAYIQQHMTAIEPTLARPVNLRSQRFNQHLTPCSLLVEVGTSGNTLQEALRGARYFAQAAGEVYQSLLTAG